MNKPENIVQSLSIILKKQGYRKNRLTWYKEKENLTVVFSIEKSRYDTTCWYYWYGICLHPISSASTRSMGSCQIKYRVDSITNGTLISAESAAALLQRWESMYGDLHALRLCAIQGKLPAMSTLQAKTYLTSLDLSKL